MGILLTILGGILSIIKFILLFILVLIVIVLFVIAVLLFAPINYSFDGEYDNSTKTDNVHATVFYSLKFIYVDFGLKDKKTRLYVKLFGRNVYDTDNEGKPQKNTKSKNKTKKVKRDNGEQQSDKPFDKSENSDKVNVQDVSQPNENIEKVVPLVNENDNEKIEFKLQEELEKEKEMLEELQRQKKEEITKEAEEINENIENIEKVVPIDEDEYEKKIEAEIEETIKKDKKELDELEEQRKEAIKEAIVEGNEKSNTNTVGDDNQNIEFELQKEIKKEKRELEKLERQKKKEVKAKIKEEKEKSKKDPEEPKFIDKVKIWLDMYDNYPEKDKIFEKTKKVFVKTYRTIKPKEFKLDAEIGLKDAAKTGSTVGKIYALTGLLALSNVSVAARFDREIIKGKLYIAGKITIFKLMRPVVSLSMQLLRSEAKRRGISRFKLIKTLVKQEASNI